MAGQIFFTIGEVAAMLGVSPHTIRAWERRHQIVTPLRSSAGQRRYRSEDVDLLREVKRAINVNGLSLRLAVRAAAGSDPIDGPSTTIRGSRVSQPLGQFDNENLWRRVVDVIPELVFVIDRTGHIVESNIASARHFDMTMQQIRGRLFVDLVEPFDRSKAALLYRPNSRTIAGWELNLATPSRGPMYSFQSWPVRRGQDDLVVLVGSEMFTAFNPPSNSGHEVVGRPKNLGASTYHRWLDGLLADKRLQEAISARQLADAGIEHLQRLDPTGEFVVAIAAPPGSGQRWVTTYSFAAKNTIKAEPGAADAFARAIRGAAAVGALEEIPTDISGRPNVVTAIPFSSEYKLGVVGFLRPTDDPLSGDQRNAVDRMVSWIAVATQGLFARNQSKRQSSQLSDVVKAASVVRDPTAAAAIGTDFLNRLADLVDADTAALGRITGSHFIVEAVYTPGGSLTRRGDRFPLSKVFSNALRTRQPTAGVDIPAGLPKQFHRRYGQTKHFMAVPLVFHGTVSYMVSLARFEDRPFSQNEIDVVQALSATAVLAVRRPTKARHRSATPASSEAGRKRKGTRTNAIRTRR